MPTEPRLDWLGLYKSVGELVEQNKTLYHKTDDHEIRVRKLEGDSMRQSADVNDLSEKLDILDTKVDGLSTGFTDLGGKVTGLRESIDSLQKPHTRRIRLWQWVGRHITPLTGALLASLGTGLGGYLIAFLIHG